MADSLASGNPEPFLVPEGWDRAVFVQGHPNSYRLLHYPDGTWRFEHRCDRGDRGTVICAPLLDADGHTVYDAIRGVNVTPSISCPDCGTHGFVRESWWTDA